MSRAMSLEAYLTLNIKPFDKPMPPIKQIYDISQVRVWCEIYKDWRQCELNYKWDRNQITMDEASGGFWAWGRAYHQHKKGVGVMHTRFFVNRALLEQLEGSE